MTKTDEQDMLIWRSYFSVPRELWEIMQFISWYNKAKRSDL